MEKIKTGIIVDTYMLKAWEYKILLEISNSDYAQISLVLKIDCDREIKLKHRKRNDSFLIFQLQKLSTQKFRKFEDYDEIKDVSELLNKVLVVPLDLTENGQKDSSREMVRSEIKKSNLDVIINFSANKSIEDLSDFTRFGVWAVRTDNKLINNKLTSDFWRLFSQSPVIRSILEAKYSGNDKCLIISSSFESVLPFCQEDNRNIAFWRASLFIPRVLEGIYRNGEDYFNKLIARFEKDRLAGLDSIPSDKTSFRAGRNFLNFIYVLSRQIRKKVFHGNEEDWKLMFSINSFDYLKGSFIQFKDLASPKNRLWADPFVIPQDDRFYVFVEEILTETEKGHITVLELDRKGNLLKSQPIIERPYHMSYPFVFELNNTFYMIPETAENRTIDLYKCKSFPYEWEFDRTIMNNLNAADATLFNFGGKWWLFTSIDKTDSISGYNTELFLFFSTDLLSGKWESHPLNPVISDVRTARPAGKIFIKDGKIYRPSQDCSGRYGKAFNINQILTLTETDYDEILVRKVEPDWNNNLKGAHTFNSEGGLTIIDAYSYRKRAFSSK